MPTHFLPDEQGNTTRPELISVLGLFTFINAGAGLLLYGFMALAMLVVSQVPLEEYMTLMRESAARYVQPDELAELEGMFALFHAHGAALMGILFVRALVRLVGAVGIWNGRRGGFHLYAAAQLVGIFVPHLVLPWHMLGFFGPLMSVAFTALYGSQYKRLG